ncbi:MAG: Lrp/AsnC ligand binding domain-containing protein [Actinomycetota bacterium]
MDAYILIQTEPGLATAVMNALVDGGVADRALAITGNADVFARINDVEWDDLKETLLNRLQRTPGVVRSSTSVAVPTDAVMRGVAPSFPVHYLLSRAIDALVFVNVAAGSARAVVKALAESDAVRAMAVVTGEYDLILQVRAPSISRLATTILREIQEIPGVTSTTTSLILAGTPLSPEDAARARRSRKPARKVRKPARKARKVRKPARKVARKPVRGRKAARGTRKPVRRARR